MQKSTSLILFGQTRSLLNHLDQKYALVQLILCFKSNKEKKSFYGNHLPVDEMF